MSKRMEWPLKTAQKEILKAFDQFVIENKSFLENKKLLVWGRECSRHFAGYDT